MLTALLLFALPSFALDIPPAPTLRVNDYAGVLSVEDRRSLDAMLAAHEHATSNQIVIAIFPSLEGENLEAFSIRLAEAWKIGQAGKDNGVIVSVFLQDRKVRIEVGYGLEGALPDVVCKRIIDEEITPRFREQDYTGGLRAAIGRIGAAIGDTAIAGTVPSGAIPSRVVLPVVEPPNRPPYWSEYGWRWFLFVIVLFGSWIAVMGMASNQKPIRIVIMSIIHLFFGLPLMLPGGKWSPGGPIVFVIVYCFFWYGAVFGESQGGGGGSSWSSGGSNSSSSGGGGGSFGGGGASGGW